ncbi:unnamed protein product [Didymodactylos carnosus]|uniref:Uncharacterized protein n=1 Tax=Didymodactylos carnosus TaxID=1234261 RepID=A0A815RC38_9BILA|nr:unnamed protein product [Didymodactylos carnosus]CAF4340611.1 unnamed protein product [Didymodactylos carnosus]
MSGFSGRSRLPKLSRSQDSLVFAQKFDLYQALNAILIFECRQQILSSSAPRGSPWIPVDPRGSPWIPMDPHGSPWIPMDPHGSPWIPMDPHGSPWIPMDPHGSP